MLVVSFDTFGESLLWSIRIMFGSSGVVCKVLGIVLLLVLGAILAVVLVFSCVFGCVLDLLVGHLFVLFLIFRGTIKPVVHLVAASHSIPVQKCETNSQNFDSNCKRQQILQT